MAQVYISASSGNVAAAVAAASLPAAANRINYITGFHVTGAGATAGLPVQITVTGVAGGTLTYIYTAGVGILVGNNPLMIEFPTPMPATGSNVAITVSCPSLGLGNTNNAVNVFGFYIDTVGT